MIRIRWSVIVLLLLTNASLLTVLSRPAAAQQDLTDNQFFYKEDDNCGTTEGYGYAQIEVSDDATMLDAWAQTSLVCNGGPNPSEYGAAIKAAVTVNHIQVDNDNELSGGSGGDADVYFMEMTQPTDQWDLTASYGTYEAEYCDPLSGSDECDPTYDASSDVNLVVGDPTPVIYSVTPSSWYADGVPRQVTVYGTDFGDNPSMQINDTSIAISSVSY